MQLTVPELLLREASPDPFRRFHHCRLCAITYLLSTVKDVGWRGYDGRGPRGGCVGISFFNFFLIF